MMKKFIKSIFLSCSLVTMMGLNQVNAEEVFIDKAVAIANDEIILKSELDNATNRYIESLKAKGVEIPNLQDVRKNILEQLIINSLIMQLAKKNSFDLSDTDVDRAIEYMARSNNMTPKQLIEEAKKNGFSEALFRAKMKEDVITNELKRSQVRSRINISDQEAEQLAINLKEHAETQESYHLANILIRIPQDATPAQLDSANRRMKNLIKSHDKGESFATLARKYSEAPNAIEGGEMGKSKNLNELPPELAQIIDAHEVGDLVGPLKIEQGLLLIKIYDKGHQTLEPIEQVKVRHILLTTSIIFDDDKAQETLAKYRQEIINGDSKFEDLARVYSKDPGSSFNGGLMDWANPDIFDPRFKLAVANLKVGEISEPFKSSFGWHIVLLEGRKVDTDSLEAYRIKAREILQNREMRSETEKWERELRDSSYVKIME